MINANEMMDAKIKGQMGQPAALMISNTENPREGMEWGGAQLYATTQLWASKATAPSEMQKTDNNGTNFPDTP
jgi:hypothetical protein